LTRSPGACFPGASARPRGDVVRHAWMAAKAFMERKPISPRSGCRQPRRFRLVASQVDPVSPGMRYGASGEPKTRFLVDLHSYHILSGSNCILTRQLTLSGARKPVVSDIAPVRIATLSPSLPLEPRKGPQHGHIMRQAASNSFYASGVPAAFTTTEIRGLIDFRN
jgi:hypothetical protein